MLDAILAQWKFDSWQSISTSVIKLCTVYGVWKAIHRLWIEPFFSPLRDIPGPPNAHFFWGNLQQIFKADPGEFHGKWANEYGPTLAYTGILRRRRLMTLDHRALSHVLNHSYRWQKPQEVRDTLAQLLGEGVLFAEGDTHKRQRRIMNPSFALSHLRELTEIFHEKSLQLRNIWLSQANESGGVLKTNVISDLSKATLDIIGLAGFDYEFNALNPEGKENELNKAFMTIVMQNQRFSLMPLLQAFIPPLRLIRTKQSKNIAAASKVMDRIGHQLIQNKKQKILAEAAALHKTESGEVYVEKSIVTTRDLLSRLMVANMAQDLPENQRLSDEDVLAQIPTFLIAGHETTATATTWCLYALSLNPEVQRKLREELLKVANDSPSMDEINALPYLDCVIRETFRVHPPVPSTVREAVEDDIVPLASPFTDKKGRIIHELTIRKGDRIFIPIVTINTNKGIWGEDAHEFKPERWQNLPENINDIPGVLPGLMSFNAGPRSCIGYRFAIVEFKCLIFALVRAFQFELTVSPDEIAKRSSIVTRPILKSDLDKGPQLPLKITVFRN